MRWRTLKRLATPLLLALLAAACSTVPSGEPHELTPSASPVAHACLRWLQTVDDVMLTTGAVDARAAHVPGFPHLRVNRPLLHLNQKIATPRQEARWLSLLSTLALEARTAELANVSEAQLPLLQRDLPDQRLLAAMSSRQPRLARAPAPSIPLVPTSRSALLEVAANCHQLLLAYDVRDTQRSAVVRGVVAVPDHYSTARRALGLYGVTRLGVAAGIRRWEKQTYETFQASGAGSSAAPAERSYSSNQSTRRVNSEAVARLLASRRIDALGRPILTEQVQQWLLQAFMPVFEIKRLGPFDDPGRVSLDEIGAATVDVTRPTIYTRISYAADGGRQLVQLVYTIWFTERPVRNAFDIYAGRLDGVTIRLTLNERGQPAVIDSIHPCGCYHQFFHTSYAKPLPKPARLSGSEEWRFMPTTELTMPVQAQSTRLYVSITSGEHYINRVSFEPAVTRPVTPATVLPADVLTSLALGSRQERRSLYGPDGIVPGTERSERWLLWPMGIKSAGAMRQPGTQATAFVGRRHFDDGDIIDSRFDIP